MCGTTAPAQIFNLQDEWAKDDNGNWYWSGWYPVNQVSYLTVDHSIQCDMYKGLQGDRGGYYFVICIYAWLCIFIYVLGIPLT